MSLYQKIGKKQYDFARPEAKHVEPERDYALSGFQLKPKVKKTKVAHHIPRRERPVDRQQDEIDEEELDADAFVQTVAQEAHGFRALKGQQVGYVRSIETLREQAIAPGANDGSGLYSAGINRWNLINSVDRDSTDPEVENLQKEKKQKDSDPVF